MPDHGLGYNGRQMAKCLLFTVVTFMLFYYLEFYVAWDAVPELNNLWTGSFFVLSRSYFLVIHFWLCFFLMLYWTGGSLNQGLRIIRCGAKGRWLSREITEMLLNCVVFCLVYILWIVAFNFILHGWSGELDLKARELFGTPVNYSIYFILLLSLTTRILCGAAIGLAFIFFYLRSGKKLLAATAVFFYCLVSEMVLKFGVIFYMPAIKLLLFPAAVNYDLYTFGSILLNYLTGFMVPIAVAAGFSALSYRTLRHVEIG